MAKGGSFRPPKRTQYLGALRRATKLKAPTQKPPKSSKPPKRLKD